YSYIKIKKKAETFISEYHKALNKAYKKADYKFVEKYIKEDSKLSKHTKHIITSKKKVKFSELEIKDVERNQNDFYIT
ncbi:TcaA NTF2-like domain-containing protein, partial [Staphylococcus aureus]|uniref:TcaA NTF2-like domain-containing protein n=1 Tax=Staphylococcus aureus TaxID=1280 RepID=UPI00065BA35C